MIRQAAGLKVIKEPASGATIAVSNRRIQSVSTTDRAARSGGPGGGAIQLGQAMGFCPYAIVLDGSVIYVSDSGGMPGRSRTGGIVGSRASIPPDLDSFISVASLKAVEVYSGPGETPGEYASLGSQCGVIVLWTK